MPKASSPSKMERKRAHSPVAEDDDHDQTFFVDEADGERFKMVFQGDLNRLSVAKIRRYLRLHNINDEDELRYEGRVLSDDMRGAEFGLKRGVVLKLRKPSPPRKAEHHQAHHQQQQQQQQRNNNNNNISAKGSNIKAKNSNINAKKKHVEEADSCRDGGSQTFEERVRLNKDMFALRFHIERVRDDARNTRDGASMKLPALHERHSPSPNAPTSSEMSSSDLPSPTVLKLKKKKLLLNKASSPAFSDVLVDASAPESYGRGDPNVVRPAKNARVRGYSPPRNNNNNNNTTNSNKNNAVSPEEMCGGPSLYIQRLHEMLRQAEALGYTPNNNNNNNNATPHLQSSVLQLSPQQSGPQYEMPLGAGVAPDSLRSSPAVNAAANVATSTPGTARPPHTNTAINDNNNINSNNVMEEIRDVREAVLDMTGMLMEMKKRGVRHLSASSSTTDSSITLPREEYTTYGAAAGDRRGVRQEDHHVASLPMRVPSPLRPSHRDQQRQPIMDESGEEEFAQRLHDVLPRAEGVLQALLGALHVVAYEPLSARQREEGRGAVPPRTSSKKQHITPPSQSVFADEDSMPTGRAIGMELRGIRGLLKELEARVEGSGEGSGRLHPQQQQQQQQQQRTPRQSPTSKDGHLLRATTPLGQDLRRVINYTEHALVDLVEVLQQSQRSQHDAAERSSPRPENQRISPDAGRRHSPRHAAHHVQDSTCARVAQPPPSQRSLSGRRSSPLQSASVHQHRRRGEHHRHPSSGRKEAAESREEAILHEVHDIHQALRNLVMREDEGAESRTSPIRGQRHLSQHAGRFSADVPSPHSSAARSVDTRSTRPPPPSSATDAPIYDGQRLHETVQRAEQVIHHLLHIAQGQPNVVAAANNNKMGEAPNVSTLERKDTKRFDQTPYSGPLGVGVGAQDTSTTGSTLIQQSVVEQLGSVQHMVEDLARVVRSQHNLHDPSTSSPSAAVGAARTTPVSRQFEVLPLPPSATGFGEFASAQLGQQQHNRSAPASPPLPQQQQFDVDGGVPSHVVEKRLKHITVEVEEVLSGLTQLVRALEERGISPTTTISKTMNDGSSRHTLPEPSYENRAAPHASASNVVDQPQQMAFREQFYTELPSQAVEVAPMTELHPGQSATLQLSTQMRSYNDVDVQQQQPYSGSLQSQHSPLSQQSSRQISGRGSLGSQPTNANNNIISSRGSTKQLYRQALTMLGDVENILGDLRGIVGNEGQPAQS